MVIVTELLIELVELPIAFIGDWGGLDGFERAVPGCGHKGNIKSVTDLAQGPFSLPFDFLIEYDPRCDSVASLSTMASNSP